MRLIHSFSPFEEVCVVLDADNRPVAVAVDREKRLPVGAVCLARACKSVAAGRFLDVGGGMTAFLNAPSFYIRPDGSVCRDRLNEGDFLLVQISRPAADGKEAEADTRVSLPGKTVVLTPALTENNYSGRLTALAVNRLREHFPETGVLFRTAAAKASINDISAEISELKDRWNALLNRPKKPQILSRPERDVFRLARKYAAGGADEIVTDDAETAAALKKLYSNVAFEIGGVWEKRGVGEAVDAALNVRSPLPSGGFLITEQTAACVCFDVNSGSGGAMNANVEACAEILRQIDLKNLGGQMIVDFAGRKDKRLLIEMMNRLKRDDVYIAGYSPLGLVELTVEKNKRSLFDDFCSPANRGAADVARTLWFASAAGPVVTVRAPAAVLSRLRPCVERLKSRLNADIDFQTADAASLEGIRQ